MSKIGSIFSSLFKPKPAPFKAYTAGELKMIAMKARVFLEQLYKKQVQSIQQQDSLLMQVREDPAACYRVLQELGRHVVEVESMRIYAELLKKIEDRSAALLSTGGDLALLRVEANWFRCLLWYRRCRQLELLNDFSTFCHNFFRGFDLTSELNPLCEIFHIYPVLRYQQPDAVIPLGKLLPKIKEYLRTEVDYEVMAKVLQIDRKEVANYIVSVDPRYAIELAQSYGTSKPQVQVIKKQEGRRIDQANQMTGKNLQPVSKPQENVSIEGTNCQKRQEEPKKTQALPKTNRSFMSRIMQSSIQSKAKQQSLPHGRGELASLQDKEKEDHADCTDSKNEIKAKTDIFVELSTSQQNIQQAVDPVEPIAARGTEELRQPEPTYDQKNSETSAILDQGQACRFQKQVFNDQQQSLRFIRETLLVKKRPVKKPYMVSIYARAEFMERANKN